MTGVEVICRPGSGEAPCVLLCYFSAVHVSLCRLFLLDTVQPAHRIEVTQTSSLSILVQQKEMSLQPVAPQDPEEMEVLLDFLYRLRLILCDVGSRHPLHRVKHFYSKSLYYRLR